MRISTQRLIYRFPSHVGFCWTREWHLTSRRMIADTAAYAKRCRCRRRSLCRRCGRGRTVAGRTAPATPTGTAVPGPRGSARRSLEVSPRSAWWRRPRWSASCRTAGSCRLRTCWARGATARGTGCSRGSTGRASCPHAPAPEPWWATRAATAGTPAVTWASRAVCRDGPSANPFERLPSPSPQQDTSGSDRTDSDFCAACRRGTPCRRDTHTWRPSARFAWRSLCSPRRCLWRVRRKGFKGLGD